MKGNLLIVDDETLLLKKLKLLLDFLADEVFTATNGKEALEVMKQQKIHCVICDINMPVMNGVDVIKSIRKDGIDVPFIFYTGHGNHELMLEAAKYGAFDFLNKPNLDGLEEVVERGLNVGTKSPTKPEAETDFLSEYAQILKQLEK